MRAETLVSDHAKCSVLTKIPVSSYECCFTLSPLLDKNEMRYFSDSSHCVTLSPRTSTLLADSKLFSWFPFIWHRYPDDNVESPCIILVAGVRLQSKIFLSFI